MKNILIVAGIVFFVLVGAWIYNEIIAPNVTRTNKAENQMAAVANCQIVRMACETYKNEIGVYPGSLNILVYSRPPYINGTLGCALLKGYWKGYKYFYTKTASGFTFTASPEVMGETGVMNFIIDQSGSLRSCDQDNTCEVL
ncbi:MAG TPA: hypothetical protein PKL77_00675 [Candidatus Omnitrophota bacterium]|nr:hypothetical protein [Candidatus Omnitrophota bacterium]HPT06563.1 hypothetical protein [Candidatus Omnitrophota bacterium]